MPDKENKFISKATNYVFQLCITIVNNYTVSHIKYLVGETYAKQGREATIIRESKLSRNSNGLTE